MNIIKTFKFWFGFSGLLIIVGLVAMFTYGYRTGIDFAGGTILELEVAEPKNSITTEASSIIISAYKETVNLDIAAQSEGGNRYFIRSAQINNDQKNNIITALRNSFEKVDELRFETVDPTIGADVVRKAILALILAVFGILVYVAYAFRRVPGQVSSWRFGGAAIIALVHDVLILLGIYAIVSRFWGAEIDSMFITALLTLLGFSVHDTIVTFDRVRENLRRRAGEDLKTILNDSIVQTIVRSINTSFTLFLVLVAMFFFGGLTIKFFTLAMIIGVVIGTYSSIFIASPLLLIGYKKS
ncbi:protein translocase subunit SecF [Patescibacteria group bacterium]|nr:protein translocase subunit SecF [Patescibacteria group bacterium]